MDSDEQKAASRRLNLAFELFEAGCEIMKQNLKRRHPDLSSEQLQGKLVSWLQNRPGAEHGDAPGRPGRWPRNHE